MIIKGAGDKSFCAGGDVRTVVEGPVSEGKEFFRNEYRNNELIGNYKKPYIAIIDGEWKLGDCLKSKKNNFKS